MEEKEELKTLKDIFGMVRVAGSRPNYEKELKQEAIKRILNCCPNNNVGGVPLRKNKRCIACERDIWFNNLTEKDLK